MKISDITGILKKNTLAIHSINNPFEDYHVITLDIPNDLTWKAGEHGIFTLPGRKVSGQSFRVFSISSIPEEGKILIATHANQPVSDFKKQLFSMSKGDQVKIKGPFGWFKVQDTTSPIVMIATGIGITPVRAIIKSIENEETRPIHLVHSSPSKHLYRNTFEEIIKKNRDFHPVFTTSKEQTIETYTALAKIHGNEAYYYLSGKLSIIRSTKKELKKLGIKSSRIINDPYIGY